MARPFGSGFVQNFNRVRGEDLVDLADLANKNEKMLGTLEVTGSGRTEDLKSFPATIYSIFKFS